MNHVIAIDLYWLPLGAGGRWIRFNGRAFEYLAAGFQRRRPKDLYHSALIVTIDDAVWTIELCPQETGVHGRVAGGAVGSRLLRRIGIFRYEARCWREGSIPDIDEAVASPVHLSEDREVAVRMLGLMPKVPTPVWGRDELDTGEMWNSNSMISWLLERAGVNTNEIEMPPNGRAPGWNAGVVVARRVAT